MENESETPQGDASVDEPDGDDANTTFLVVVCVIVWLILLVGSLYLLQK